MRGIEQRLSNLESAHEEERRIIIFVEYDGSRPEDRTGAIIDKCKAACDTETYEKALGAALLAVNGKNTIASETGISFLIITTEVATKLLEILQRQGIEVSL